MRRRQPPLLAGVALAGVALCASACGGSSAGGAGAAGSGAGGDHLTIWSQWLKGQPGQQFLQAAVDDFQKQTGIKVTVQWKGNAVVKSLLPALNSPDVPTDVVETSASQIQNVLYPAGGMLDLTSAYQQQVPGAGQTVAQVVGPAATSLATPTNAAGQTTGGPVVVPYWASATGVVFYNGQNFPALESAAPKDWDAFFTILDAQKAKNRRPLAQDGSVTSYNAVFYNNFLASILGPDALNKAEIDKTGQTWKQPGYLQAAQLVERLAKGGYFTDGYDASKFPAMENKWANNDADFNVNGSWLPSEVGPVAAPGFDYRSFAFPAVAGHSAPPLNVTVSGIGVLKSSKHQAAAEKFAAFLLQRGYQEQVATKMQNIPIAKDVPAPAAVEAVKQAIDAGQVNTVRSPASLADYNAKIYFGLDDKLIFGKLSAAQFIDSMSSDSADYWKTKG